MSKSYWSVPRMWPGQTFVCIGGGPSLTQAQVDYVRGRARTIGVNDAYRLAAWLDVLYFCDVRWWRWHRTGIEQHQAIKVTLENHEIPGVFRLRNAGTMGLAEETDALATGRNSGYQVINLAAHLGARRILLIGYDMKVSGGKAHWFGDHDQHKGGVRTEHWVFSTAMLPCFPSLVEPLQKRGIEVVNCTPDSALEVFPKAKLEEAL